MPSACNVLLRGTPRPLADLLQYFFQEKPICSVSNMGKTSFQAVVEIIYMETGFCSPELCLVLDPTKACGDGWFAFVDVFFAPPVPQKGHVDNMWMSSKFLTLSSKIFP